MIRPGPGGECGTGDTVKHSGPMFPAMLLELFSHQNFLDMRFGQEPMFRFHVSRAIYKGMLKFLHAQYGIEYVVQPLPVDHFQQRILTRREQIRSELEGQSAIPWNPLPRLKVTWSIPGSTEADLTME